MLFFFWRLCITTGRYLRQFTSLACVCLCCSQAAILLLFCSQRYHLTDTMMKFVVFCASICIVVGTRYFRPNVYGTVDDNTPVQLRETLLYYSTNFTENCWIYNPLQFVRLYRHLSYLRAGLIMLPDDCVPFQSGVLCVDHAHCTNQTREWKKKHIMVHCYGRIIGFCDQNPPCSPPTMDQK